MRGQGFGKQVTGAGGVLGGGRPKRPREEQQSRFSNAELSLVAALSEGPIEGFYDATNPLKSIYIDKTPIVNADGSVNFRISGWDFRPGVPWQTALVGYSDGVFSVEPLGVEVAHGLPVTRTIINENLDSILVTVTVVSQQYPDEGGLIAAPVHFRVWVRQGDGAWELRHDVQLNEVFSSATPFEFNCPVDNANTTVSNFQVRVERVTPTDTDVNRFQRQVSWASYQQIIEAKLRYPSLALFALRLDRREFDNAGEVAARIKGRTVQIPSNATVAADGGLDFTGFWDGQFFEPTKACRCPVMQLYDVLTSKRYGAGNRIDATAVGKAGYYQVSQYCNGLVDDGKGGQERRFQCDIVLDQKEEAIRVIDIFRTLFRGLTYYLDGAIRVTADMPRDMVIHQFTMADVENGMFEYSDQVGLNGIYTRVVVWWNDPDNFFERTPEYVVDREGVKTYGFRDLEISIPGCTSQGQAQRAGWATLLGDRVRDTAVVFKSRMKGVMCLPGDLIQVADAKQASEETGGLIADADTTTITLDREVNLLDAVNYTLYCTLADGAVEERLVTTTAGQHTTVTVSPGYSQAPGPESNWVLASFIVQPQLFQVIGNTTVEGAENGLYEIQAVKHDPSFYAAVEEGLELVPRSTRYIAEFVVNPPRNMTGSVRIINNQAVITFVWDYALDSDGERDQFIKEYRVQWRRTLSSDWSAPQAIEGLSFEVENPISSQQSSYNARIAAVNVHGRVSRWVESGVIRHGALEGINAYAVFTSPETAYFATDY